MVFTTLWAVKVSALAKGFTERCVAPTFQELPLPVAHPVPSETYLEEAQAPSSLTGGCGVGSVQHRAWLGCDGKLVIRDLSPGALRCRRAAGTEQNPEHCLEPMELSGSQGHPAASPELVAVLPHFWPRDALGSVAELSGPRPLLSARAVPLPMPTHLPPSETRSSSLANPWQGVWVGDNHCVPTQPLDLKLGEGSCCLAPESWC